MGGWLAAWGGGRQKGVQNPPDFAPRSQPNLIIEMNINIGMDDTGRVEISNLPV